MFVRAAPYSRAVLEEYRNLLGDEIVDRIRLRGAALRGLKVLHINATLIGGGVSEMLFSLIPLMRQLGIRADWYVLDAEDTFFEVTKRFHNALQGGRMRWLRSYLEVYRQGNERNASSLAKRIADYDVVVVHDPQPLALRTLLPEHSGLWIWRCHIDMTRPNSRFWNALSPFLNGYGLAIFSTPEYVPAALAGPAVDTALPCIDPFRAKNAPVGAEVVARILDQYGIDENRPYLLQVSRFDPWKDPLGVVEVYRRVKREWPEIQLVYMASMASDDPEGARVYEATRTAVGDDPDAHLLALDVPAERVEANALEVNAMQAGARVVLQKSIREGFGLTVAEALWKGKPVVAGNVGGIRYQIEDGVNGYLVDGVDDCTDRVLQLLADPDSAARLGQRGREVVRSRFLTTRLLEQYLGWFSNGTGLPKIARAGNGRNGGAGRSGERGRNRRGNGNGNGSNGRAGRA